MPGPLKRNTPRPAPITGETDKARKSEDMQPKRTKLMVALLVAASVPTTGHAGETGRGHIDSVVGSVIRPMMERYRVPGMAVGIVSPAGSHLFEYGVASKASGVPVTRDTLFEIGSISKTFTATLASYAQVKGALSLTDSVARYLPALDGSSFGSLRVLELGTHTPGGMPLQFPDTVTNEREMMAFFRAWQPAYAPGTYRTYANPSIGMLGRVAARSLGGDFTALMRDELYPALGLDSTYLDVPEAERTRYAQGYTKDDRPVRMSPGALAAEAYGVRTTAADLARFVEANIGRADLDADLQKAVIDTRTGYYRLGAMTQDLVWEQYDLPVDLEDVLAGTSPSVSYEPNPVSAITPPLPPRDDVLINKTGSTFGFGAYVAFIPGRSLGIVMLANKNYPVPARVTAAHEILRRLDGVSGYTYP